MFFITGGFETIRYIRVVDEPKVRGEGGGEEEGGVRTVPDLLPVLKS
jgi:hypothetical protein